MILGGLKEGERVVVGPYKALESLKHDQAIKDEREGKADSKEKVKDTAAEKSAPVEDEQQDAEVSESDQPQKSD